MQHLIRHILLLTLIIACGRPSFAQSDIVPDATLEVSGARKAVRTSTDVLAVALPAAAIAGTLICKDWTGLKQGAFTAVTTVGLTLILKYSIKKERPDHSDNHSFPSMHTAVSFASAAYIQRRYGWKFGIPAYALAAYVGWGRTYGKKHDWVDVITGAAIGAASAYIYTRPFMRKHSCCIIPVSDGNRHAIAASFSF